MSLRRYSRRDLGGRLSSLLPNGAKRGSRARRGGAHGQSSGHVLTVSVGLLIPKPAKRVDKENSLHSASDRSPSNNAG